MLTVEPFPYQNSAIELGLERGNLLIAYGMGLGKEQPVSEPVLTPAGWVPIGDIQVGDLVIGKAGEPVRVTGTFPQGEKHVYRVSFNDGSSTRTGWDHLWEVRTGGDLTRGTNRVLSTGQMTEMGLFDGAGNRKFRVPMVDPVVFSPVDHPIDPYLLGVLIGDGCIKYVSDFSSADSWIVDEVRSLVPPPCQVIHRGSYNYSIRVGKGNRNPVTDALRSLGLFGRGSHEKFIPERYLRGSVNQRVALLQGLLDTDGHVRLDNNVEFCSVSKRLADDVLSLVRSLGGTSRVRERTNSFGPVYRLSISVPESVAPFRIPRKAEVYHPRRKYPPTRLLDSVVEEGIEESVCIMVDAADHLYVTADYVVTHNTLIQMAICEELLGTGESTLNAIVVPASLKWQWAQALVWGTDVSPREFRVKGQKIIVPERHHAVVIDGTPEKRDTQYEFVLNYRPNYVILGYGNVVNDWRWVKQLKPDLISLDEATAIKTFSAERTKQLKLWDAPFRYALTGTPIDNRADELFSIMEWVDPSELGRDDLFEKAFVRRNRGKVLGYKNLDVLHKKVQGFVARKTRFDPDVAPYMPKDFHREFHVNLVGKTKEMYKEIAGELIEALEEIAGYDNFDVGSYYAGTQTSSGTEEQGNAMARHNALTMLCDDPHLLLESAWKFENDFKAEKNSIGGSKYAWQLLQDGRLDWITDKIVVPKFERTVDLIMDEVDENADNKIIVFSFAKGILRYFKNHLKNEGVQAVIFSGDQTSAEKEAAKQAFKTDPQVRVFLSSDAGGMGVDLPEANTLCVDSSMSILTSDLRWVPAGSLKPGDQILGCDEDATPGKGVGRHWRIGTVLNNQTQIRESLDVSLTNGETLMVTPEHRMLVWDRHGKRGWVEAQNLRPGMRISKYFDTWTPLNDFDAGWLSGLLDGEGCVQTTDHGLVVSLAQKEGLVLDRAERLITDAGFTVAHDHRPSGVHVLRVIGNKAEQARFLGTFLPGRLVRNWQGVIERFTIRANEHPEVKYTTRVGKKSLAVLETDVRTYVGDGYIHHNCNYNHPWSAGKADQRNSRHIRAGSLWDEVAVYNMLVSGSVEEWKFDILDRKRALGSAILDGGKTDRGEISFDVGSLLNYVRTARV